MTRRRAAMPVVRSIAVGLVAGLATSLAATAPPPANPPAPGGEVALSVRYAAPTTEAGSRERALRVGRGQVLVVDDLDREDAIEGATVSLPEPAGAAATCRIQAQYETGLTLTDSAPHADLLEWLHYTSEWADAKKTGKGRYQVPALTDAERRRFPSAADLERSDVVQARGGEDWAGLVTYIDTPGSLATVDVSAIRVRVACGDGPAPEVLGTVEFRIPRGC